MPRNAPQLHPRAFQIMMYIFIAYGWNNRKENQPNIILGQELQQETKHLPLRREKTVVDPAKSCKKNIDEQSRQISMLKESKRIPRFITLNAYMEVTYTTPLGLFLA